MSQRRRGSTGARTPGAERTAKLTGKLLAVALGSADHEHADPAPGRGRRPRGCAMADTDVEPELSVSVSTSSVSERDGFAWFSAMVGEAVMPLSITSAYTDNFRGTATSLHLPQTGVSSFSFSPGSARRTPAHIRLGDPECYFLLLVHGSPIGLEQGRNSALLNAGDMTLFDTSHPLVCEFEDHHRLSRVTLLRLPRTTLPLPANRTDGLLGTRLSSRSGVGALLAGFLGGLRENAERCDAEELRRLDGVGAALAATFLAGQLTGPPVVPAETRRQALLARIQAFIEHNLSDPELGPTTIAAHHHISVRLLHQLFQKHPETVSATIRRLRLERGRADLADRRLGHRSIGETAARWGFRHQADFARAFRLAYGMSPSAFRQERRASAPERAPA
ncbi:helix-turn-helix domain-containing protein [Streptomyces aurantiacus]|uniref:Putative transcriptional activator FeaR n=1 Tax=Streptomyces aurantiacus JA 4570 TaxID=1286094 RepID=S3ZEQ9_9ACTN|nr:helix-turn-helix domain-containing protein [Streptomyces aurantiacus]EPH41119.1 putative transcriptional activator FeaR [Streptomyces aurantiacus JA 4570]